MPRTSESARHTLAIVGNDVEVFERIRAPKGELTAEELVEVKRVVNCTPGDWFTPVNTAALVQYSRHVIAARRVAEAIEAAVRDGRFEELDMLLQVQARESKILL